MFYVRWFNNGTGRFEERITENFHFLKNHHMAGWGEIDGKQHNTFSIVDMDTGFVLRNDYKRRLPDWLFEPVQRAIIASTKEIPPIYKNPPRKKGVDGKAVPA